LTLRPGPKAVYASVTVQHVPVLGTPTETATMLAP
jgi:hypothetical protein